MDESTLTGILAGAPEMSRNRIRTFLSTSAQYLGLQDLSCSNATDARHPRFMQAGSRADARRFYCGAGATQPGGML